MAEGPRSDLYVRDIPGGLFHIEDMARGTGSRFYVGTAVTGAPITPVDNAGAGRSPLTPFATLDYAIAYCTANQGDIIYLLPGHAEALAAAGDLAIDIAGISIIGLGEGSLTPTITLGTDPGVDVDIDAANVLIENVTFVAGVADIVAAIDVNADDFTMRRCRFLGDNAGLNALIWIQDDGAASSNRITIEDCYCLDRDASNTHFINCAGTGDGHIIRRNTLMGDFGTMCIGGAGVVTNIVVADNTISNTAADADSCINFAAGVTGIVVRNLCGGGAAVVNGVTAQDCAVAENYYQLITADLSGVLDPAAT
jgi:hypothetical protein